MKMVLVFLSVLFLSSCTSANKPKSGTAPAKTSTGIPLPAPKEALPLITFGVSSDASLTPGNEIFFNSSGRLGHSQAQIYSYDLNTKTEKRWTYTLGNCYSPQVSPDRKLLIYACDSDEAIENPAPLRSHQALETEVNWPFIKTLPSTEIYLQEIGTREITRLTDKVGYDGTPRFLHGTPDLVYTAWNGKQTQLLRYKTKSKTNEVLFAHPANQFQAMTDAKGEKLAWIRFETGKTNSEVIIGDLKTKKTEALPLPPGFYLNPSFSSDSKFLVLSAKSEGALYYQVVAWDFANNCLKKWAESASDLLNPQISADLKTLYMGVAVMNQNQIFKLSKDFSNIACNK